MKFKLTSNKKVEFGVTLYQIQATESFGSVTKGDLGGWVEKESNLNQDGDAWVYGDARVSGDAWVYGDARVSGDAWVYGDARVSGDAWVYGKLKLLAGCFFGFRYKKEEIKFIEIDSCYELIYKGDAKFGEDEPEVIEMTLEEVAKLRGVDVKNLRIKE